MKTYNLFISHSWSYGDQYDRLEELLQNRGYFDFKNYSVPQDDPIHTSGTDKELRQAIYNQILPCSVVLILAGVYASHSKWIKVEIDIAKKDFPTPKPIVAIKPWGSERTSTVVKDNADCVVGWNTNSIVEAIRDLA